MPTNRTLRVRGGLNPPSTLRIACQCSESRHARNTARPALSPCRSSFLFFCGGGNSKKEWAAKARGGFLLGKRKGVIQIQKGLAIHSSLKNGEAQRLIFVFSPPP